MNFFFRTISSATSAAPEKVSEQWDALANQLFSVLRMACESKVGVIMESALDCFEVSITIFSLSLFFSFSVLFCAQRM
jgi:hypothetical protein